MTWFKADKDFISGKAINIFPNPSRKHMIELIENQERGFENEFEL